MFVCRKSCCSSPTKVHEPDAHKKHWKQPGHSRCQKRGLENSSKSVFIQSRERLPLEVSSNLMGGSVAEGGGESHLSQHSALFNNGVSVRQQLCVHQLTCRLWDAWLSCATAGWKQERWAGPLERPLGRRGHLLSLPLLSRVYTRSPESAREELVVAVFILFSCRHGYPLQSPDL